MTRLAALVLLWVCSFAGVYPITWTVPSTGDKPDSCDVVAGPLHDTVRTLLRVRDAARAFYDTTYTIPAMPGDSMWANIAAPSGHVYTAEITAQNSVGTSCRSLSLLFALQAENEPPPPPPDTSGTGITARYYNGKNRNTLIASLRDTTINFQWGLGSPMPGVNADQFSADWRGKLVVPMAGTWTLFLEVDDGGRLSEGVPNASNVRIDKLIVGPLTEWSWTGNLAAGEHGLEVVFMADTGNAQVTLRYAGPGISKRIVPREALR